MKTLFLIIVFCREMRFSQRDILTDSQTVDKVKAELTFVLKLFSHLQQTFRAADSCGAVRQAVRPGILYQISKLSEEGDKQQSKDWSQPPQRGAGGHNAGVVSRQPPALIILRLIQNDVYSEREKERRATLIEALHSPPSARAGARSCACAGCAAAEMSRFQWKKGSGESPRRTLLARTSMLITRRPARLVKGEKAICSLFTARVFTIPAKHNDHSVTAVNMNTVLLTVQGFRTLLVSDGIVDGSPLRP